MFIAPSSGIYSRIIISLRNNAFFFKTFLPLFILFSVAATHFIPESQKHPPDYCSAGGDLLANVALIGDDVVYGSFVKRHSVEEALYFFPLPITSRKKRYFSAGRGGGGMSFPRSPGVFVK